MTREDPLPPGTAALSDGPSGAWTEDRAIRVGLVLALVAAVCQVITQAIDFQFYSLRIAPLNSDTHASIFGILSLVAQGAAAVAAAYRGKHSADHRRGWLLLSALLGVLLVARALLPGEAATLSVPVAVAFVMFWWLTRHDSPHARAVVIGAMVVLAFSFVVHIVGPKLVHELGYGYSSWPYQIKGMLKHSAELSGWILAATGVFAGSFRAARTSSRRRRAVYVRPLPGRVVRSPR